MLLIVQWFCIFNNIYLAFSFYLALIYTKYHISESGTGSNVALPRGDDENIQESILKDVTSIHTGSSDTTYLKKKEYIRRKFLETLDSTTTLEQLEVFERAIAPIAPTLAAMNAGHHFENYMPQKSIPHNKNIVPQRRFFATRKKKAKRHTAISKPSKEESDAIATQMMSEANITEQFT